MVVEPVGNVFLETGSDLPGIPADLEATAGHRPTGERRPEPVLAATLAVLECQIQDAPGHHAAAEQIAPDRRLDRDLVDEAALADLGWRTDQFVEVGRGFSFNDEAGLEMTYGQASEYSFTAEDIVNDWDEGDIANVLYGYGEERYSRRIAAAIVEARKKGRITNGKQLAEIIAYSLPAAAKRGKTNPATKSFQGLRIAVNDEFEALEHFIAAAFDALTPGGRLAIISFHSLEDRIVKLAFRNYTHDQKGVLVTKKPMTPSPEELKSNPRSRSAKLRVIQKLP